MDISCPACGSYNPANSEFCDACGCELEALAPPAAVTPDPALAAPVAAVPVPQVEASVIGSASPMAPAGPISAELPPHPDAAMPASIPAASTSTLSYVQPATATATQASKTAKLICQQAGVPTPEFQLGTSNVIGRFDSDTGPVDIDLENFPGDDTISRNHGEIYYESGLWKVKDLGSTNGIFIKSMSETRFGTRINVPTQINDGDELALGKIRFLFQTL